MSRPRPFRSAAVEEAARFQHDFSRVSVFSEPPAFESLVAFDGKGTRRRTEKPKSREVCDRACGASAREYGRTECDIDLNSGLPNGKVAKYVGDTNPCTRPCVEVHEDVHAKTYAPICAATKRCLDRARSEPQEEKCLDKFEADMARREFRMECSAYKAEEKCLRGRAKKAECTSEEGKKRFAEQTSMVKCYKGCFCGG